MARTITVQIVGDATQLERSFKKAGDAGDSLGKRWSLSAKTFAKAGAIGAAAGGVAIVTKQLFASVNAAKEAEKAAIRLDGALDSANVKAKGRARALKEIDRISKLAALDDEDLSDALAKQVRTTGSLSKGLKDVALAANIARARDISLAAAAKIVEKARTGQLRGLKAIGVEIGKNTTAEEALERAQRKFAGSAERYGKTAAGAQDKLSVAFENLQERIGAKLLPILTKLTLKLVYLIDWTEKNWPRISRSLQPVVAIVKQAFENISGFVKAIAATFEGVVKIIDGIRNGEWSQVWSGIKQIVVDGSLAMLKVMTALPRKIIAALGSRAWDGLKAIGASIKDAALGGLQGLGDAMVDALRSVVNRMIRLVNSAIGKFNAIPIAPDIPKIPEVGGTGGAGRGGLPAGTRTSGPRDRGDTTRVPASTGAHAQPVVLNIDGRELGRVVIGRTQRAGKETAASRRGPFAGQRLALG